MPKLNKWDWVILFLCATANQTGLMLFILLCNYYDEKKTKPGVEK